MKQSWVSLISWHRCRGVWTWITTLLAGRRTSSSSPHAPLTRPHSDRIPHQKLGPRASAPSAACRFYRGMWREMKCHFQRDPGIPFWVIFFFFLSAPSIPKRGSTHLILSRYILFTIDTFYEGWHVLNWKTFTKKNKKRVPTSLSLSLSPAIHFL